MVFGRKILFLDLQRIVLCQGTDFLFLEPLATLTGKPVSIVDDQGVPKGLCVNEGGGKYSREWSNGKATLDCTTWTAELPFSSL